MNRILLLIIFFIILFLISDTHFKENLSNTTYTPDELFDSLKYISTFLTNIGVKHWLMYGTLLGAVRNNEIIP